MSFSYVPISQDNLGKTDATNDTLISFLQHPNPPPIALTPSCHPLAGQDTALASHLHALTHQHPAPQYHRYHQLQGSSESCQHHLLFLLKQSRVRCICMLMQIVDPLSQQMVVE